jgi:Transmembrane protein 43
MARSGLMSAPEMFKVAEDENRTLTWILRAVGVLAMFIGFALVLFPLSVIADFVQFIGSIVGAGAFLVALVCTFVLAPALIAVAWLWYRPLISIAVLVVGLGVAYGFRTLAARRTPARAVPAR